MHESHDSLCLTCPFVGGVSYSLVLCGLVQSHSDDADARFVNVMGICLIDGADKIVAATLLPKTTVSLMENAQIAWKLPEPAPPGNDEEAGGDDTGVSAEVATGAGENAGETEENAPAPAQQVQESTPIRTGAGGPSSSLARKLNRMSSVRRFLGTVFFTSNIGGVVGTRARISVYVLHSCIFPYGSLYGCLDENYVTVVCTVPRTKTCVHHARPPRRGTVLG